MSSITLPMVSTLLILAAASAPAPSKDYVEEIRTWQQERFERLRAPDGWVTLTGLAFVEPGTHRIGADPEADVVLDTENAPAAIGVLEVSEAEVRFRPDPGITATADGEPIEGAVALRSDAEGGPTVVRVGSVSFFPIERDGRIAIRSRDAEHPAREALEPIETWPIDPQWRLIGRFVAHDEDKTISVPNILGTVEDAPSPGRVEIDLDGRTFGIDALDGGDGDLFLVFGDRTNGAESYGGGRFLYTPPPAPDGTVVVDFNKAYNPPCAFTPWATCPLPPPANRLDVAIPAGEKEAGLGH